MAETGLHAIQMTLMGALALSWLLWRPGFALFLLQGMLVLTHAVIGYLDTRVAWQRRAITPREQHLHSVLDIAPWIAVGLIVHTGWLDASAQGWPLAKRAPALPGSMWVAVLVPALALCIVPLLREWRQVSNARHAPTSQQQP